MKTKSFLVFSTSVFATSLFLIIFHSQQPQSLQNIVTQTHQHIKDFQRSDSTQENLRDVEEKHLVQEERYYHLLGLDGKVEQWHNSTLPVLVTYAQADDYAMVVGFIRHAAKFPYTILVYNMGLNPHYLAMVSNYCNSSKCVLMELDLVEFPQHVSDLSIHAFRPLIIQHALSRVGGVIFVECTYRWTGQPDELAALWKRTTVAPGALLAWPRRPAVTSLTHPRMFHYFDAELDDFLFVQMVDTTRLMLVDRPQLNEVMRAWIQCALTLDCIMPIGAQSVGCKFDKKPQYRYSGCHGQDASALSIILGLKFSFEETQYTYREKSQHWRRVTADEARDELASLERNTTEDYHTSSETVRTT